MQEAAASTVAADADNSGKEARSTDTAAATALPAAKRLRTGPLPTAAPSDRGSRQEAEQHSDGGDSNKSIMSK